MSRTIIDRNSATGRQSSQISICEHCDGYLRACRGMLNSGIPPGGRSRLKVATPAWAEARLPHQWCRPDTIRSAVRLRIKRLCRHRQSGCEWPPKILAAKSQSLLRHDLNERLARGQIPQILQILIGESNATVGPIASFIIGDWLGGLIRLSMDKDIPTSG
jgi:hypothetical protein